MKVFGRSLAIVGILVVTLVAVAAEEAVTPLQLVEAVMAEPPATGLIVTGVGKGSQAAAAGILPGDVLTAYAGQRTKTLEDLQLAKRVATQTRGAAVEVAVTRPDGSTATLPIGTGQLGVEVLPVEEGVAATRLPPATDLTLEVDALRQRPLDAWFGFRFPPAPKLGFEHAVLQVIDDRIELRHEVAFDGGRRWGLNHFVVTVVMDASDPLRVREVTYVAPLAGFESKGTLAVAEDGTRIWRTRWQGRDVESGQAQSGVRQSVVPTDLPIVPSYFVHALASLLPKEAGNAIHFRPLSEGDGRPMLKSALVVVGQEALGDGESEVTVWRVEQRRAGGQVVGTYWVDDAGRILRSDYGGPVAFRTSQAEALASLHPDLEAQTAD